MGSNFINDFIDKLTAGNRPDVYLSVTPGVGLEMIQIDDSSHTIKSYAVRPLAYNESLREISNMDDFKKAVTEMFEELKLNPKCNITLNLPTVLFSSIEMSLILGDEAITGAVTSEVEQSYVFKRHDPIVQWWDSNVGNGENRKLFYSAVQQLVVESISSALAELGANLVGVEMSILSTLRALDYTGLAASEMQDGVTWNLLTVNSNGYTLVSLTGKNVVDYYEEPIAIKSYEGDEIYNVISSSAQITLMSYPTNYLLVLSDTDSVSAEVHAKALNVDGTIEYIENNKFKRKEFLPVSLDVLPDNILKISLQAIGVAVSKTFNYPISCNFLSASSGEITTAEEIIKIPIGENEFTTTPTMARVMSIAIAILLLVPVGIAMLLLPKIQSDKQSELDELNASIQQIEKEIKELKEAQQMAGKFSVKNEINKTLQDNRVKLMAYSAIGESVPPQLWLSYFSTEGSGKILIKGGAGSVEDIYTFYKNLKEYLVSSDLKLQKLEMISDNVDEFMSNLPVTYDFEISNISAAPAPVVTEESANKGGNAKNAKGKSKKSKSGKTTGKAVNLPPDKKLLSDTPIE